MQIYFVYDGWDETYSVWEIQFYSTKELAEAELDRRIAKLHEDEECAYNRKMQDWKIKNSAVEAVLAAGLPIPSELSWIKNSPPTRKKILNHGLSVDYVEVIESEG